MIRANVNKILYFLAILSISFEICVAFLIARVIHYPLFLFLFLLSFFLLIFKLCLNEARNMYFLIKSSNNEFMMISLLRGQRISDL